MRDLRVKHFNEPRLPNRAMSARLSWLSRYSRMIPVYGKNVQVLKSPNEFYETILVSCIIVVVIVIVVVIIIVVVVVVVVIYLHLYIS